MNARLFRRNSPLGIMTAVLTLALLASGCAGGGTSSDPDSIPGTETPTMTGDSGSDPAQDAAFGARVAWLNASSANTFLQASLAGLNEVASEYGIEITEFDAQFDPALQQRQLQDAITSGQFDGIILTAIVGPALIADVEDAIAKGIKVVILNQVVGQDLTTAEPQVPGISASVLSPAAEDGTRLGEATVMACEGTDPCRLVYFFGQKGIPFDDQVRSAFDNAVEGHAHISVLAEGESGYEGPDASFAQMQDFLVRHPDFEVVVGADQAIQGAALALDDAARTDVLLIGTGGSEAAIAGISEGRWFAGIFSAPRTEGRLAMEAMVEALNGKDVGGVDATGTFPNNGIVTADNVGEFEAQWEG